MSGCPGPLRAFEKWLYPSMLAWLLAMSWMVFEVWPNRPFVSTFDSAVATILTLIAAVTGTVALILSYRKK